MQQSSPPDNIGRLTLQTAVHCDANLVLDTLRNAKAVQRSCRTRDKPWSNLCVPVTRCTAAFIRCRLSVIGDPA